VPEAGSPARADKTGGTAPFKVDRGPPAAPAYPKRNVDGASETTQLARFRAGEVHVHEYVDLKGEEATKRLMGLPAAELAGISSILSDQLRTDPGLTDLVHMATGRMPSPPED